MIDDKYNKALNKAKIALMSRPDSVFFTTVCFSLKHIWDDTIPTASTDGLCIRINPDFFLGLSMGEQVFLLVHESMHVAYLHMERLKERDHIKWNIAADYVINLQLQDRQFNVIPGALVDEQYRNMSTEEVYRLLPDNPNQHCPMLDLVEPADPNNQGSVMSDQALAEHVQEILVRAATQSKMAGDKPGTIPGDIEIYLDKLLNPKLPWQRILQKYMQALTKNDYSFRRPNRRFFPDYYLPGLFSESLVNIAVAIDTSGSVLDEEFQYFVSETAGILKIMRPEKISIIQFDTNIKSVDEVRSLSELRNITFTGRGGTLIQPVMDWAIENKPNVLLVFSDGYFRVYQGMPQPKTPIIWLIHEREDFDPPYGKVIHYEMELNNA